jgi:hypothetical protein
MISAPDGQSLNLSNVMSWWMGTNKIASPPEMGAEAMIDFLLSE